MRTIPILVALMIAGTATATVAQLPTCQQPGLEALCIQLVIGDVVVGSGDEEEWSNGTYVVQGRVTVQSGGTFRIIDASVAAGQQPIMVQVEAGGALVILDSDITGAPAGAPPQIVANASASVTITESTFTGMTLVLRTDDAQLDGNSHARSNPALRLEGVSAILSSEQFAGNVVAVNVTGGSPELHHFQFTEDGTAIQLYQTSADVLHGTMSDVSLGIDAVHSQGAYKGISMDDRKLPPTLGFNIEAPSGVTTIEDNEIVDFGTGIRCTATGGQVQMSDNSFSGNGQDVAGDC